MGWMKRIYTMCQDGTLDEEFTKPYHQALLDEKDIVVTPGSGYGEYGEGYIRLSLTIPDEQLDKGINKLIKRKE